MSETLDTQLLTLLQHGGGDLTTQERQEATCSGAWEHQATPQGHFQQVFSATFWTNPTLQDRWRIFLRRTPLQAPEPLNRSWGTSLHV